jgi:multiple sugar transport system substrate-binding protein
MNHVIPKQESLVIFIDQTQTTVALKDIVHRCLSAIDNDLYKLELIAISGLDPLPGEQKRSLAQTFSTDVVETDLIHLLNSYISHPQPTLLVLGVRHISTDATQAIQMLSDIASRSIPFISVAEKLDFTSPDAGPLLRFIDAISELSDYDTTTPIASIANKRKIITIAYNRYMYMSFSDSPPPLDIIRHEVAKDDPNVEIQLHVLPDNLKTYHRTLVAKLSSKDPTFDIVALDAPWMAEFGENDWVAPINDLPGLEENHSNAGLDVYSYQGKRIGVPFWSSLGGLYYRTDLLQAYGFDTPETYDELITIVEAIRAERPELYGFLWAGNYDEALMQVWIEFFHAMGGDYSSLSTSCFFKQPSGVAALEFMTELIRRDITPRSVTLWKGEQLQSEFANGNAIFLRYNFDTAAWLNDPNKSQVVERWDLIPNLAQPGGRSASATGGFAFAMNPHTKFPEETKNVLRIIADYPVQKGFALAWGPIQYHNQIFDDGEVLEKTPYLPKVKQLMKYSIPRFESKHYAEISRVFQENVHRTLMTDLVPEQTMKAICVEVEQIIKHPDR